MRGKALLLLEGIDDPVLKLNLLREYLQVFTLRSLQESEAFTNLSFAGGTALRFLFGLPRFSEDIDFSLEHTEGYALHPWSAKLRRDLEYAGFQSSLSLREQGTVHTVWIRTAALLRDAGLAAMPGQKLAIKVEIDTRPPAGAICHKRLVTRHLAFVVQHHDLPSLMAGKIHALVTRKYTTGWDWFDLLWYRGRRPPVEPNLELLQNAFLQTEGEAARDAADWSSWVAERARITDFEAVAKDVHPFLERREDAFLMERENILSVLPIDTT